MTDEHSAAALPAGPARPGQTAQSPGVDLADLLGSRLALGLDSLRLVVMFLILLDTLSGAIATLIDPFGVSSLRDIGSGLLAAGASAALLWRRHLAAGVLCIVLLALTFALGPSGDDTVVLVVLGVLAPNRYRRRTQWWLAVVVLGYAVAFGLRQEGVHPGWGWPAALTTVLTVLIGFAIGLAARRLLRTEKRRRDELRRIERENAEIRAQERSRLADELQLVVTAGLAQVEAEVRTISADHARGSDPSDASSGRRADPVELHAGLSRIDEASRALLTQLRSLLELLRRDASADAEIPNISGQPVPRLTRWLSVRNVRILGSAIFGLLALLVLVVDHPAEAPAHWLKFAALIACGVALWRPRGTQLAALLDVAVLVATVAAQDVSGWDALAVATLSLIGTARFGVRRVWLVVLGLLAYDGIRFLLAPTSPAGYVLVGYAGALGLLVGLAVRSYIQARAESDDRMDDLLDEREGLEVEERNAVARELHDVVAHQLSVTTMVVMATTGTDDPEALDGAVHRIRNSTLSARLELDVLLHMMRGVAADQARTSPLVSPIATAQALQRQLRESGHTAELDLDPAADTLDQTSQRTLTRIMQESTTNILRYAPAGSPCTFRLLTDSSRVELVVTSPLTQRDHRSSLSLGWGLRGIRERVELTHGTFEAGPSGTHWSVRVSLPRPTDGVAALAGTARSSR